MRRARWTPCKLVDENFMTGLSHDFVSCMHYYMRHDTDGGHDLIILTLLHDAPLAIVVLS